MNKSFAVIWKEAGKKGRIEVNNSGRVNKEVFSLKKNENRFVFTLEDGKIDEGAFASIITVRSDDSFSFFARDVDRKNPIYIKEYSVIVTEEEDKRTFDEIVCEISKSGRRTELERLCGEPEESFETASQKARNMRCSTWLGISRDVRMFEVTPHQVINDQQMWNIIAPKYHHTGIKYKEIGDEYFEYQYFAGRGIGHQYKVTRWLENDVLPILNVCNDDDSVKYYQKMFVSFEKSPLNDKTNTGTDYLVSDIYALGSMRTPEQEAEAQKRHDAEIFRDEETVLYLKIECVNVTDAPKYAFVRLPYPNLNYVMAQHPITQENGYTYFTESGLVLMVSTLNGKPFSEYDSSILLKPGEKATFICKLPHYTIPRERAEALMKVDYDKKLAECTKYWEGKLKNIAQISLPDKRIENMMKAGYLHLDLVCFGKEPDGPVCPVVGVYGPIGTESTPIIQYIESMGSSSLAGRAISYFTEKQHEDGFIQTFGGYMSETGPALWNIAEHFFYTHDMEWLKKVKNVLIKGCDYIKSWIDQSLDESLKGKGYGMIFGKVADDNYPYHYFMLNATTYGGLRRAADALAYIDKKESDRIGDMAEELRKNIIDSLEENFALSPAVPLSDGSWVPSVSLWPSNGTVGLKCLFANGGQAYTHGSMVLADGLLGGEMYLVTNGVLPADNKYVKFISNVFAEILAIDNVGYSQPYYNQEPYGNILRGEVGAYISEFYNLMAALADRETYTFWEHLWQCSPHKTHEEGWFLMRCRWMLIFDEHGRFDIFGALPRAWLSDCKKISIDGLNTRYGKLKVKVLSEVGSKNKISADISLESNGFELPDKISIRLPHPDRLKAVSVNGGTYDEENEKVLIENFNGKAHIEVNY